VAVLSETAEPRRAVESCRSIGAPLLFVCFQDSLQWWKQGKESAEWIESIPAPNIDNFFRAHQDQFSPEAVYRAKTLGRVRSEYQLDFVDAGMMPLLEEEVGTALSKLISRNVAGLKKRLGWDDVTSAQGQWLLQTIFWLVSGKILRDKQVPGFEQINLEDVDDVFYRVGTHYGTQPFAAGSKKKAEALHEAARTIDRFSSLALTTSESLAYVYENTLISKQTRAQLGTHSTPTYLVDYVLGHLADWIEEIPENDRSAFEPACGHAGFLVSAMRLLTQLLPADKAVPSRRGPYLRSRLHGTDIDAFALELARLSLTLTDIPNPDGWDLRVEDMFVGNRLEEQAKENTILLANPPFANFSSNERNEYELHARTVNKTSQMLRRTLPSMQTGSVFGVVVPVTILHGAFAEDVRQLIAEQFELREISVFPDKVFSFSDSESAILLGRRLPTPSKRQHKLRFRRVRERQMRAFRETYVAPSTQVVEQSRFNETTRWDLRVPDLDDVWSTLGSNPTIQDVGDFGTGMVFHGQHLPKGVATFSAKRFKGAVRGFKRFRRDLALHEIPDEFWFNLNEEVILRKRAGTTVGTSQIVMNEVPVSRGPWRIKALIDRRGHATASSFIVVRPTKCSLESLWALLNSPIANAFAYCHLGKRHNDVGAMRTLPLPSNLDCNHLDEAVLDYMSFAMSSRDPDLGKLQSLMRVVDARLLRQYDLPIEIEQSLLSLFTDWQRVGVPFEQGRFLPEELEGTLRYADFVDYESDWVKTNRRRGELIDKDIAGKLTSSEREELDGLQAYADYHLQQVAPRPTAALEELEDLVLAKVAKRDKDA